MNWWSYVILIVAVRFLSRVSILTRDSDIANLSVRPSICLSACPLRSGIRWKRLNISTRFFFTVREPNHSSFTSIKHFHKIPMGVYLVSFARYSDLLVENREIFIPHLYLVPRRGWPRPNSVKMFDAGKTRMIALPYGENNYDDMLSHFHLIAECNRRTDRQMDRRTDRIAILISRVSVLTRGANDCSLASRMLDKIKHDCVCSRAQSRQWMTLHCLKSRATLMRTLLTEQWSHGGIESINVPVRKGTHWGYDLDVDSVQLNSLTVTVVETFELRYLVLYYQQS